MSDISIQNLDANTDSPKLARVELLESVVRVNALTQRIKTNVAGLTLIDSNLQIDGAATNIAGTLQVESAATFQSNVAITGNLTLEGTIIADQGAGSFGQVLSSTGPVSKPRWITLPAVEKYRSTYASNLTIDNEASKTIIIDTGLAYVAGQSVLVSKDASNYFVGIVSSYNSATGGLTFTVIKKVGAGTHSDWEISLTGETGQSGSDGVSGPAWYNGVVAPAVGLGTNDDYYINTATGEYYQKQAGAWVSLGNLTGPAGSGGGNTQSILFGTTARYQAVTTTGQGVTIVSSARFKTGISWSRVGTALTVTDNDHGRSVGERAIVRNMNSIGSDSLITSVTQNTFTINCPDTGDTSGVNGAYSMGFTFAYNAGAGSITSGTITAPTGWDCVLLSIRIRLAPSTRVTNTFILTVPKGNLNGAGPHTGMDDVSVPVQMVRQDGNTLTAVGNTISTAVAVAGDYATYQFAALPPITTGIHILAQF